MADIVFDTVGKTYPGGVRPLAGLDLIVAEGEFLVLVGASGCGKSTALRMLAGLEEITDGEIRIGGRRVNELSPQARNIAMVFQSYALYPHMTVRGNLSFPLEMSGMPAAEREARIAEVAATLELGPLLDRRPKALSGGQRQRVAMGRALVRRPAAFLMDEPLSNLDAKLRVQMRSEILDLQRRTGITTVYVTHDQVEAMTMGDRVAVLRGGALQQVAPPDELYHHPTNLYVAAFIGSPSMNLLQIETVGAGGGLAWQAGDRQVVLDGVAIAGWPAAGPASIGLRPEAFVPPQQVGADRRLAVTVDEVESLGHERMVHAHVPGRMIDADASSLAGSVVLADGPATIIARLPGDFPAARGQQIELGVDSRRILRFDATGRRT
jgi:multiple sugar transport system ATP-binding protein